MQLSELLEKYVKGTCTADEAAVIDEWYSKYADKPGYLETLSAAEREFLSRRLFNKIINKVTDSKIEERRDHTTNKILSITTRWWFKLSAAAVLLIVAKIFVFDGWVAKQLPVVAQMHVKNSTHAIVKQALPDGSIVWLRPGASLTFPKTFTTASRNVLMNGECFFEITKNPQRPFIISSKHVVTKVWGTSFQVADFDDAREATVTVVSGKVSVSKKGSMGDKAGAKLAADEVMLAPEQKVTYKQDKDVLITDLRTSMAELILWKHVDLSFSNSKLASIVKVLSDKFKVKIEIADAQLYDAAMTADLTDLNLPEVLEVLKTSMKINYEINNDLITLKKTN